MIIELRQWVLENEIEKKSIMAFGIASITIKLII